MVFIHRRTIGVALRTAAEGLDTTAGLAGAALRAGGRFGAALAAKAITSVAAVVAAIKRGRANATFTV